MGPTRNASIVGGIAGIIGWAVFAVAFAIAPTPPTLGASAAEITRYYGEHHAATLISAFLFATTAPLFAIWAGPLAARLRAAEGEAAWLYLTFVTGTAVTLAVDVCASFMFMALSGRGWTLGVTRPRKYFPTSRTTVLSLPASARWFLSRRRRS
jgi:hypothetical protein